MAISSLSNVIISFLMALLAMAFFTLLERKVIGYAQTRKGPNKVGLMGIPQPLADAFKLLTKEQSFPSLSNLSPFLFIPLMTLFLALSLWMLYPTSYPTHFFKFGTLMFLAISSLNVFMILGAGWTSNSKYALLGALRSVAQTISYEVSMILILLGALVLILSFNISILHSSFMSSVFILAMPLFMTWFTSSLAETNRSPFDFAEGESELVSGFNTEFSAGTFTLIFMAEYMNILMISILTSIFFLGILPLNAMNNMFLMIKTNIISFLFLWVRASLPRMRYDRLMNLTWLSFLPFSISMLLLFVPLSFMIW